MAKHGWKGPRPVALRLYEAVMLDVFPDSTAAIADFWITDQQHYEALYYPIRAGEITLKDLDRVLGDPEAITKLVNKSPSNPHKGIVFGVGEHGLGKRHVLGSGAGWIRPPGAGWIELKGLSAEEVRFWQPFYPSDRTTLWEAALQRDMDAVAMILGKLGHYDKKTEDPYKVKDIQIFSEPWAGLTDVERPRVWIKLAKGGGANLGVDWSRFGKAVQTKRLSTPAVDNKGREHQVLLVLQETGTDAPPEWVVKLDGTPGSWAIKTVMERGAPPAGLYIDFGSGWAWTNVRDVMDEALRAIEG